MPKQQRNEMQALSPEQAREFLRVAEQDRFGTVFTFALATGMRPGEYLGLQWKDLDLQNGTVMIRRVLVYMKGKWHFAEPKTPKSRRTVLLPPGVIRILAAHKKQQAEERLAYGPGYENLDLVFAGLNGQPLDKFNMVNRHFKPILCTAGLPESFRLYDLRHSCATLLLVKGENPKIVSELLGHASIVLTLDTYSYVLPTMQQSAVSKMQDVLFGQNCEKAALN